jgi:hypothetical protein
MSGGTLARQSELTAWSQEAYQLPRWGRTGENQVYVRQQKAAGGQKRFDTEWALSGDPSGTFSAAASPSSSSAIALKRRFIADDRRVFSPGNQHSVEWVPVTTGRSPARIPCSAEIAHRWAGSLGPTRAWSSRAGPDGSRLCGSDSRISQSTTEAMTTFDCHPRCFPFKPGEPSCKIKTSPYRYVGHIRTAA